MDLERALIKLLSVLPRISRLGGRPDLLDVLAHAVEDAVLVCKSADDLGTLVYWLGA
jgi:2C-methyl-D-erythritol 2,4-cyclodiphosphate synthase